ncbi:MAG: ABC transporter ATP-binding protein/permease [candidate division WOR-3 bacterium]|nr:ABC transporter ATP-binding protein/permease [candidate division WOR-3 bacterium]
MLRIKLVLDFWKLQKRRLIFLVLFTAIGTSISLSFPLILRYIIDGIQTNLATNILLRYVAILLAFGIGRSLISVFLPFARGRTNELFMWHTRNKIFTRILGMGHRFSNQFPSGDVIERLDHDLNDLSWFACSGIFRPTEGIFTIIIALIILIKLNPLLTLITVMPVTLAIFVWLRLGPLIENWYHAWRVKISETNNQLESTFSGIKLAKSYVMEQRIGKIFRNTLNERIAAAVKTVLIEAKIGIMFNGIAELGILLVLWVGGMLVIKQRLTLGEFVAFNGYILMLITPMFDIGNFFVAGKRAQAAEKRIREIGEFKPDVERKGAVSSEELTAPSSLLSSPSVEFNDVGFSYNGKEVLRNINIKIQPGAKIGIAGTVGSGKSTLMRLLLGVAEPSQGNITLNGTDIKELDLTALRQIFGYAPQEPVLFSDTIKNNILFGRTVNPEEIQLVTKIAQLQDDLKDMPKGLDEMIGERGLKLSGGQKARVAIARALLGKPKILLLDDVTSNLDAETEQEFINDVNECIKDTTLVIVSHRLAILSNCDIVYVLDNGEIIEKGTHDELLAKKNLYWKLYQRQLMAEELERM